MASSTTSGDAMPPGAASSGSRGVIVAIALLAGLGVLALVGLAVSIGQRRPLPQCATYRLDTPAWEHAALQTADLRPTLREREAERLVGCARLLAMPVTELVRLLGQPPDGTLGHPGYDEWTYPLAFVAGSHEVPRSVLTIAFDTKLVSQAAIVRFGAAPQVVSQSPVGPGSPPSGAAASRRSPPLPPGASIPGAAGPAH